MLTELKYWYLRNHKLFWVLNNSQIKKLCIVMRFKQAKKGEIISLPTDEPRIFFLKKGHIKLVHTDDEGNEYIRDILKRGDIFGEFTHEREYEDEEIAIALTNDVIICSFLHADFEKVMTEYPHLAVSFTKLVGFKLKKVKSNYNQLVFKDARSRLIHFLKSWSENDGEIQTDGSVIIPNYLTQNDIAQIICTSRQTATQMINELEQKGLIKYERKFIQILSPTLAFTETR